MEKANDIMCYKDNDDTMDCDIITDDPSSDKTIKGIFGINSISVRTKIRSYRTSIMNSKSLSPSRPIREGYLCYKYDDDPRMGILTVADDTHC